MSVQQRKSCVLVAVECPTKRLINLSFYSPDLNRLSEFDEYNDWDWHVAMFDIVAKLEKSYKKVAKRLTSFF